VTTRVRRATRGSQGISVNGSNKKRYNLEILGSIYEKVKEFAEMEGTSVADQLHEFILLGVLIKSEKYNSNAKLMLREGDHERELVILSDALILTLASPQAK
jgi:hypothetical protein